ncbi:Pyrophosphatase PpaX [bioreactor metagenome]|uniref:Pyrophosphatase PpaX n=1 Tax=bioreactor metagenome TaxID=1076179 RepID=A0A644YQG1_9ZZZZ
MEKNIRAIFLDLGGTFRIVEDNLPYKTAARRRIAELCGTDMEAEAFHSLIEKRYDGYRDWALKYMCEAPEEMLWTRWLAPECDKALLERNAVELTYELRKAKGERVVVKNGIETVKTLVSRGYKVGVISDLIGTIEIDEWLDRDGLRPYFCTVQQSSVTMLRKPHPAIYFLALKEAAVRPEESVFVGDNLERDIIGAKASNFGATIAVEYPGAKKLKLTAENMPDGIIKSFDQLLEVFPQAPIMNLDAMEQRSVEAK